MSCIEVYTTGKLNNCRPQLAPNTYTSRQECHFAFHSLCLARSARSMPTSCSLYVPTRYHFCHKTTARVLGTLTSRVVIELKEVTPVQFFDFITTLEVTVPSMTSGLIRCLSPASNNQSSGHMSATHMQVCPIYHSALLSIKQSCFTSLTCHFALSAQIKQRFSVVLSSSTCSKGGLNTAETHSWGSYL